MKQAVAIFADFQETFLGHASRLAAPLCGTPLIARTLARARSIDPSLDVYLVVRPRDEAAARDAAQLTAGDRSVSVLAIDDGLRPRRGLIRSARKWNLSGWRGSPLGTTWFDEFIEPSAVARVLDATRADALLCLDGYQPLLDADIARRMLAHARAAAHEAPYVFTHAPPGIAGVVLGRAVTAELLSQNCPLGLLLAYRPESPRPDPITKPPCLLLPGDICQTPLRLTGDTQRSFDLLNDAITALGDAPHAATLCDWTRANPSATTWPLEIEIELTTQWPLPHSRLRPRDWLDGHQRTATAAAVRRVAEELHAFDESAIVLGGHGDPLVHPEFSEICASIRRAGVTTLGVTTPLVDLPDAALDALLSAKVDAIEVTLDANTPQTYERMHGLNEFNRVLEHISRIVKAREQKRSPQPLILCSMTRCDDTQGEIEEFVDRWTRDVGWAVVRGFNDYCRALSRGQLPTLEPPLRSGCKRLRRSMVLLADGRATACGQDFQGSLTLGRWDLAPIRTLWNSVELNSLRERHDKGLWSEVVLCARCTEWSRP